jgi:protein TIF31
LHKSIALEVERRFRYKLADEFWKIRQFTTLRSICLKVGIQILARKVDFGASTIFSPSDILNVYPVLKHAIPRAAFAADAMEHARQLIGQSEKEKQTNGLEIAKEALGIYEQVYGPVHDETGRAYAKLAMLYFSIDDAKQALPLQRRALYVAERTGGFDCAETLQQYLNLAYFEYSNDNTALGLTYMKYALHHWLLLAQGSHPDTASVYVSSVSLIV